MTPLKHRSGTLAAGTLAVLVGGVVLLGWALDIAALKSVLPGWVSMKPNTAVAFILTGIALLASSTLNSQLSTILSRLSRFCALFAGLIGLLSLGEYAFDWNPGFDQWLFPEPAGTVGTSHPGRMASGQPVFQDFYRHELSQRVYLAALVPILDEADGHRPLGVLVLRIDPASYLYPFIRRWPVPSARGT